MLQPFLDMIVIIAVILSIIQFKVAGEDKMKRKNYVHFLYIYNFNY